MKRKPIVGRRWQKAHRQRCGELTGGGIPYHLSYDIATHEMSARRAIAAILGLTAAREARLAVTSRSGQLKFAIIGSLGGCTEEQARRLSALGVRVARKLQSDETSENFEDWSFASS